MSPIDREAHDFVMEQGRTHYTRCNRETRNGSIISLAAASAVIGLTLAFAFGFIIGMLCFGG